MFFFIEITSCQIKKESTKHPLNIDVKKDLVKLDFEILTDKFSLDQFRKIDDGKERLIAYSTSKILAVLKQTNRSNEKLEVGDFIIYENFEITNLKKESKEELITFYDYSIVFDPETYESDEDVELKPGEYFIDTLNLVDNFKFYHSNFDTFLIRIKKSYFEKELYSNWDTLILE